MKSYKKYFREQNDPDIQDISVSGQDETAPQYCKTLRVVNSCQSSSYTNWASDGAVVLNNFDDVLANCPVHPWGSEYSSCTGLAPNPIFNATPIFPCALIDGEIPNESHIGVTIRAGGIDSYEQYYTVVGVSENTINNPENYDQYPGDWPSVTDSFPGSLPEECTGPADPNIITDWEDTGSLDPWVLDPPDPLSEISCPEGTTMGSACEPGSSVQTILPPPAGSTFLNPGDVLQADAIEGFFNNYEEQWLAACCTGSIDPDDPDPDITNVECENFVDIIQNQSSELEDIGTGLDDVDAFCQACSGDVEVFQFNLDYLPWCECCEESPDEPEDTDGWGCMAPPGGSQATATCMQFPGGDFASLEECEAAGCGGEPGSDLPECMEGVPMGEILFNTLVFPIFGGFSDGSFCDSCNSPNWVGNDMYGNTTGMTSNLQPICESCCGCECVPPNQGGCSCDGGTASGDCTAFNGLSQSDQEWACQAFNNLEDPSDDPNLVQWVANGECCEIINQARYKCQTGWGAAAGTGFCVEAPDGEFSSVEECEASGCTGPGDDDLNIGDWICKDPVNFPDCQQIENETQLNLAISYGFAPSTSPITGEEFGAYSTQQDCIIYSQCTGTEAVGPDRPRPDRPRPDKPRPDKPRRPGGKPKDIKRRLQELAGIKVKGRKLL